MAKIKHTKNELKTQRDALKRFRRYLPTLQLKKQQLQMELRLLEHRIEAKAAEEKALREDLTSWIQLLSEPVDLSAYLHLHEIKTATGNIAGVNIPVLKEVVMERLTPDLSATPPWVDDGLDAVARLLHLRVERGILLEEHRLLAHELRVTSQRVNLFEKIKIPEARENIRVIRIFLGDAQTAQVARAKIAKKKTEAAS
ncbi:MAG TPA: V-type ATP synthase subunit D [Kiritimatiellia bacterium]|nr:V-type ATP synthase subunit D [Kiritimatiellia bacterium]